MFKLILKVVCVVALALCLRDITHKEDAFVWVQKTVEPADSIWTLVASEPSNKNENIADLVEQVRDKNNLTTLFIQPGQKIMIPVKK